MKQNKPDKTTKGIVNILKGKTELEEIPKDFIKFNEWLGLPVKQGKSMPIFDYEMELFDSLMENKMLWICKATGLGITELMIRFMVWYALTDTRAKGTRMLIVTGPNWDLAKNIILRIKNLFNEKSYLIRESTNLAVILNNGTRLQAQPSNHIDSSRSFDDISVFYIDEANFFNVVDDTNVRTVAERYIAKTNPFIIWVSTPYYPRGVFFDIGNEVQSRYKRFWFDYKRGLNRIYSEEDIEEQKLSPSFASEYCLQWGMGTGNIFAEINVEKYDLSQIGQSILAIDPAYGSSKFAIIQAEVRNNIIYILDATTFERPSQTSVIEFIKKKLDLYKISDVVVDSSNAGLITELNQYCHVSPSNFRELGQDATLHAVKTMNEKKVVIHPRFKDLLTELQLARFNDKGTVEKKILTMDLFDAFIMTLHKLKTSRIKIISVPMTGTHNSYSIISSDYVCNSCKDESHSHTNHSIWIEDDDVTRDITCKCEACQG